MKFEFKPSFDRSVKRLHDVEREEIKNVAIQFIDMLSQDRAIYKGIGLKHLQQNYWEIRRGLKTRILFKREGGLVEFILAGNHDDIKRFLNEI